VEPQIDALATECYAPLRENAPGLFSFPLGSDVEAGLLPGDMNLLGPMVEDISFNNAKNYFPMECD
jgi:hypothetical protein